MSKQLASPLVHWSSLPSRPQAQVGGASVSTSFVKATEGAKEGLRVGLAVKAAVGDSVGIGHHFLHDLRLRWVWRLSLPFLCGPRGGRRSKGGTSGLVFVSATW